MGILDDISGMGYDVRRVEPVKVQDAGLLTDAELEQLEPDYEGEEGAYREYLADPAPHPVDYTDEPIFVTPVEMFYVTDKHGRARAYRFSRRQMRSFPMTRQAADAAILEGRAVILDGNPLKPRR